MRPRRSPETTSPPAWAERALRALLAPRDRDTITGDLLEEYREAIVPARSRFAATLWYVRQVASFVTVDGVRRASIDCLEEGAMFERLAGKSVVWLAGGGVALAGLFGALVRGSFGPPVDMRIFVAAAVVLAASAVVSTGARSDLHRQWRLVCVCGALVAAVLVIRLLFDVFDPLDPVERFLAQARDDYSEFDYPRRWVPAAAVALIVMGGALRAAWRTKRVGAGTLTAVAAGVGGALVYVALVAIGNALPIGSQDPLGHSPADLQFFGNVPAMLVPFLAAVSVVLGSIGALFGRALGGSRNS